jgi:hypothetical protein
MKTKLNTAILLIVLILLSHYTIAMNKSLFSKFHQRKEDQKRIDFSLIERIVRDPMFPSVCKQSTGLTGKCANEFFDLTKYGVTEAQSYVADSYLKGISKMLGHAANVCFGDFKPKDFENRQGLINASCDRLPLEGDETFGVISFNVNYLACAPGATVAACFAFSGCDTVAISVSGGLAQCVSTVASAGIAAFLAPFIQSVDYLNGGYSLSRKFAQDINYIYLNEKLELVEGVKKLKGHVTLGLGLAFPIDFKIGSNSLKDLIEFSVEAQALLDLGRNVNFESLKKYVKGIFDRKSKPTKSEAENVFKLAPEFSLKVTGQIKLKLSNLTGGFLADFDLKLNMFDLIVTTGGSDTESGLPTGVYIYIEANFVPQFMRDIFDWFFNRFQDILSLVGIKTKPSEIANKILTSKVGVVMNTEYVGLKIYLFGLELDCFWKFTGNIASCKFGFAIITLIKEGFIYIIKTAIKFFDTNGKVIGKVFSDMKKLADSAVNADIAMNNFARDTTTNLQNITQGFANYAENLEKIRKKEEECKKLKDFKELLKCFSEAYK